MSGHSTYDRFRSVVSLVAVVTLLAAGIPLLVSAGSPVVVAGDDFESGGWSGGSSWAGAWSSSGDASVTTWGTAHGGSYHLRVRGNTGQASRMVNLSGATSARLQFWWKANSLESGDEAMVEVYDGSWHTLLTAGDGDDDNAYHHADRDLSGYAMASNFQVRVRGGMSSSYDYFYVDDVQILGESEPVPPTPSATPTPGPAPGSDVTSVMAWVVPGTDAGQLASDHGATLRGCLEALSLCLLEGADPALADRLVGDARVISVEMNDALDGQVRYFFMRPGELDAQIRYFFMRGDPGPDYNEQWAASMIRAEQAQSVAAGQGVTVAVLDTGIDMDHSLFEGHLVSGYDFVADDADPSDEFDGLDNDGDGVIDEGTGHGSHAAGVVHLVAPGAMIMPVRIFDSDGRGTYFDAIEGIVYAVDHGAQVINLSGAGAEHTSSLRDAVDYAWNRGVVFVASGGLTNESAMGYPAMYDHVVSVGATDQNDNVMNDFACFGNGDPTVYAPGVAIYSAYFTDEEGVEAYAWWTGNSMAAPFAAGEAALMISAGDCNKDCVVTRIPQNVRPVSNCSTSSGRIDVYDAAADAADAVEVDLRVQYRNGDPGRPTNHQIKPFFTIVNDGNTLPLSSLSLRYWYTDEGEGGPGYACDYALVGCENVSGALFYAGPFPGADRYAEISFSSGAGDLFGGGDSGEIMNRIQTEDWLYYVETDDYSYDAAKTAYEDWERVTLYYNGQLVWGIEPSGTLPNPGATPTPAPATATPLPAPTSAPQPTPTAPAGGTSCSVDYMVRDDWGAGFTAEVRMTNNGASAIQGWTLTWAFPGNQRITNLWNGSYSQSGASVSVSNLRWNGTIWPNGGTAAFGFNALYNGSNELPTSFSLNGASCQ